MKRLFLRLWREEDGQDLVEYGLLLVLVAMASIASLKLLENGIKTVFSTSATNLTHS
jgi:pilus assembly protein Flp/PilA